jgi:hypothetical protein
MKKLVIFGDSFANNAPGMPPNWVGGTARLLNIPVLNYGCAGSSLNYSLDSFYRHAHSTNYDTEDVIVFILTNPDRLYTADMPNPKYGLTHMYDHVSYKNDNWVRDNITHAMWAMEKIYDDEINHESVSVVCCLKVWAENHPNTIVVLQAFEVFERDLIFTTDFGACPNFLSLVRSRPLFKVSIEEYVDERMPETETRSNHMSECNLEILFEMIAEVITTRDITKYVTGRFKKHFLEN